MPDKENPQIEHAFTAGWIPQKAFMVGSFEIGPDGEGSMKSPNYPVPAMPVELVLLP